MRDVTVCNPLLRTPLSLIVDDSCPVINLTYYWIQQRRAWKAKHQPGAPPGRWEGGERPLESLPRTIPAGFARRWGEWCAEQGIRGKFSFIPYPAGTGRIDQGFPGFPAGDLDDWLDVGHNLLAPSFDLTPEMLTHTHVVDLETWRLTDQWEQVEWVDPPVEQLADYIAAAMQLLRNVGIVCEGVTSPGPFGKKQEAAHARAVLDAAQRVNGVRRPFYFLWHKSAELPDVPLWYADKEAGVAVASIVSCAGDWFGGWTGWDAGSADQFITEDLTGGRVPEVLAEERPCVLIGHWPGFYFNGDEVGFDILKEVKRRLDAYDPDHTKTLWMKNSEIGHYWMARELSTIAPSPGGAGIRTQFPTANFTVRFAESMARGVRVNAAELREAPSRRDFRSGSFLVEGRDTFAAFDLNAGETRVELMR